MKVRNLHNITINNVFCDKMGEICNSCSLKKECAESRKAIEVCRTCNHARNGECELKSLQEVTITTSIPPKHGTIITACSSYEERPTAVNDHLE